VSTVRRFLLRSTLLRPATLIPVMVGLVAGVASWAVGGNLVLNSLAVVGVVGGISWMVFRTVAHVENLTQGALNAQQESLREAENRQLDLLARQLRTDRDHRTQDSLRLLRTLRDEFERSSARPEVSMLSARLGVQIGQYFESAVNQLQRSYQLFEKSESAVGEVRDRLLRERETLISEIGKSLETFQAVVNKMTRWQSEEPEKQLSALQEELERNLEIARRTEERMREIEFPNEQKNAFLQE
jgi:hypothetical protein